MDQNSLITIFLTGLLTGGLTCLAVQGGLLASTIAQREEEHLKDKVGKGSPVPILWFLLAKLIAYTILGLLLGWFGSLFSLSLTVRLVMQFAVVVFMFGTAMSLLNVHPFFRYFIIQPPKFLTRMVRNQSKSKDIFAPAILGAFTVFIPCGTTQAMMALAIAGGSAINGAGIMFAFVLGTTPVFFFLGYFATRLGEFWHKKFLRVAAFAIILLTVFNLNNALALTGKSVSLTDISKKAFCVVTYCGDNMAQLSGDQTTQSDNNVEITIGTYGYTPKYISVTKNSDVRIKLINNDGTGCAQAFTIPSMGIQEVVPVGSSAEVAFHSPDKATQIAFMCSMGMYRGVINVN